MTSDSSVRPDDHAPNGACATASHVDAAWRGFLEHTETATEESCALRALTLHMLEAHAPATFARLAMPSVLAAAVTQLESVPLELPATLTPAAAQARIDAAYVRCRRGGECCGLDPSEVDALLRHLVDGHHVLHAWVLGELAAMMGVDRRVLREDRWYRGVSRRHDLYWCTHRLLLASHYLHQPLRSEDWQPELTELARAAHWIRKCADEDLAAEALICMQCVEAPPPAAYHVLLPWLLAVRSTGGDVGGRGHADAAHATAAGLLALAGDVDRRPSDA